jgi:hypothetical protein
MKNKLKVLVAEDTKIARDLLVMNLKTFAKDYLDDIDHFEIDKAESFQKAHQMIVDSGTSQNYYDILFADIDFTEDNKGGERDSGFKLIEKAFEVCPLTQIATYSGQFRGAELWDKYEELKNRGLIVLTFDKSHGESGGADWMIEGLLKITEEIGKKKFIWDIWNNHQLIIDTIKTQTLASDPFENLTIQNTIISNLESVIIMFMNIDRLQGKEIIYRMMIYLYHNSLELLCRSDKTDLQIIEESNSNKVKTEEYIRAKPSAPNDFRWYFQGNVNAQRIFVSYLSDERISFVDTLNYYRNKSIHPTERFQPNLSDVLFSALTFALVVADDKSNIETKHTSLFLSQEIRLFRKGNLVDIIEFIKRGY